MSRDYRPRPKPHRALYYLSHARGDAIRTIALRPAAFWAFVAILPISLLWAGAATFYIAFHDDMLRVLAARQTEMQAVYEDRLAQARAESDRLASRQRLDQSALEGRVHELLSRQAQLEQRGSMVAALASQTAGFAAEGSSSTARRKHSQCGAIGALRDRRGKSARRRGRPPARRARLRAARPLGATEAAAARRA